MTKKKHPDERKPYGPKPKLFQLNGRTQALEEWAKEYDIPCVTLRKRIRISGVSLSDALTMPKRCPLLNRKSRYIEFNGVSKTLKEWSTSSAISYQAIRGRLNRGLAVADALDSAMPHHGNKVVTIGGVTYNSIAQMAKANNLKDATGRWRLRNSKSISSPLRSPILIIISDKETTITNLAHALDLSTGTIRQRIKNNIPPNISRRHRKTRPPKDRVYAETKIQKFIKKTLNVHVRPVDLNECLIQPLIDYYHLKNVKKELKHEIAKRSSRTDQARADWRHSQDGRESSAGASPRRSQSSGSRSGSKTDRAD